MGMGKEEKMCVYTTEQCDVVVDVYARARQEEKFMVCSRD